METLVKLIINMSLILGLGYFAKEILFDVEKVVAKRIQRGLLSSEGLAKKIISIKLSFLIS